MLAPDYLTDGVNGKMSNFKFKRRFSTDSRYLEYEIISDIGEELRDIVTISQALWSESYCICTKTQDIVNSFLRPISLCICHYQSKVLYKISRDHMIELNRITPSVVNKIKNIEVIPIKNGELISEERGVPYENAPFLLSMDSETTEFKAKKSLYSSQFINNILDNL